MKLNYQLFPVALLCALLSFSACKKDNPNPATNNDPQYQQQNRDVSDNKAESDNINSDVNTATGNSSNSAFGKKEGAASFTICGGTVDTVAGSTVPTLLITYNGTACNNRIRTGTIKVELVKGSKWSDMGAQLKLTLNNYKVVFTNLNGHYITYNGTKYLTDVNGINWVSVFLGADTLTLRERADDMQITFDNGQTASWSSARLSKWGVNLGPASIYAIVNGDTTINGNVTDTWGTTRFGTSFTTTVSQPWISNTTCGWWQPTQGIYTCTTTNFTLTATLGTNSSGVQILSGCPGNFKLSWSLTSPAVTDSTVLGYW